MQSSSVFQFLSVVLEKAGGLNPSRAGDLAAQFSTLESFAKTDFSSAILSRADGGQIRLNYKEKNGAETAKIHVRPSSSLNENWIRFITHRTIDEIMKNINSLRISDINMNPFLIRALRLRHSDEAVRFNVYQTVTRSLVTAIGNTLQHMPWSGERARLEKKGKWYDAIKEKGDDAWDERLLVGAKWRNFVSSEKDYHLSVLRWIDLTADQILEDSSIMREVENAVERLIGEFEAEYGKGEQAMQKYLNASL